MRVHPENEFRRYAAAALGNIGIPAIEPVIDAMADKDRVLRGFLSLALCRIGKPAVGPLTLRLDDADEIIRSCATLTLWQMGETGLPAIVDKMQEEE